MSLDISPGPSELRARAAPGLWSRPLVLNLILSLAALLITAALAELGLRLFFRTNLALVDDERNLLYRYDSYLGWFPIPSQGKNLLASRVFTVVHNREGFRDPDFTVISQNGIMFLGDSFVWGYDVDAPERFTDKLRQRHPEWTIYNLGVSGYGTDQEFLLLQKHFDSYKPRVVFLVFCVETDHDDNSSNFRYQGYYKPYCTTSAAELQLRGVPVPRSEKVFFADHRLLSRSYLVRLMARGYYKFNAEPVLQNPDPTVNILRAMHDYVKSKGAVFCVGLTRRDPNVEAVLRERKIPYVDLSTPLRYPQFGNHWTPEGHTFVCERIDDFFGGREQAKPASVAP
jgi:hypothetical protein